MAKEKVARLEKWILVEAYKNGLARKNNECASEKFGPEEGGGYFIPRHDIYQRYFRLPDDSLRYGAESGSPVRSNREVRLRSAVILCESVRQLLKDELIKFPQSGVWRENQADPVPICASSIFLTEAGIRKAESLLSAFQGPKSQDRTTTLCAA